jgi:hypothetical protein
MLHFPRRLMRYRRSTWDPTGQAVTGGRALSGVMPIGSLDGGGYWAATFADVQLSSATDIRRWRSLRAAMKGGSIPLVLEARDERCAPWPVLAGNTHISAFTDDGSITDAAGNYATRIIQCTLGADAALRATSLTLTFSTLTYSALKGGERLTIDHTNHKARLYEIATAVNTSGDTWTVTIDPPLREAEASGKAVDFDYPRCIMRLASPMELPLERDLYAQSTVKFIESFPPFST